MQTRLTQKESKIKILALQQHGKLLHSPAAYFIFTFFYVLATDSLWTYTWSNRLPLYLVRIALIFFAGLLFCISIWHIGWLQLYKILPNIMICIGLMLCVLIHGEFSAGYAQKAAYAIVGLVFSIVLDFNKLAVAFVKVIKILAIYSLIFYLLSWTGLKQIFPVISNVAGTELYNGVFAFMLTASDVLPRNWGVFWEPGAYQAYLCLAILVDMFFLKNTKPYNFLIFAITIMSTLSTTGIICLGLIMLLYVLTVKGNKYKINRRVILLSILLAVALACFSEKVRHMVFSKLAVDDIMTSSSLGSRVFSILGNLKIMFKEGFFVGTGIDNYILIYQGVLADIGFVGFTSNVNTIFVDFARFGWMVGAANIILIWRFSKRIAQNRIQALGIVAVILLLLFMEDFSYSLFWMTIICFGTDFTPKEMKYEDSISLQCDRSVNC